MRRSYFLPILCGLLGAAFLLGQALKNGVRSQPGPMDAILLKDYAPDSSLVVPTHPVAKARFPVVDIHTHPGMEGIRTPQDVEAWLHIMDEVGVETSVVFTGATGAAFDRAVELFKPYANRFQLYCSLDSTNI